MTVHKFKMGKAVSTSKGGPTAESASPSADQPPREAKILSTAAAPKSSLTYPAWAPQGLRSLHTLCVATPSKLAEIINLDRVNNIDLPAAIEILGELTVDVRMKPVWAALRKRTNPSDFDSRALHLAGTCFGLLAAYFQAPKITTTERRKQLTKIAGLARDLEAALSKSPSLEIRDATPYQLVPNPIPLAAVASERPIREHLKRLAEKADQEALKRSPFAWPKASKALQRYLTGSLTEHFRERYRHPFPNHVAAVAEVVLRLPPDTIGAGAVRQQDIRTRTRTNNRPRAKK